MTTVLSQLYYLPPIHVFAHYAKSDTICLEAHEHYQKGSYRNRCHITGANGVQRLSIPLLKGKHSKNLIKEVALAYYEPWPRQHWQSIRSAYGNAPFFFYYCDAFEAIYKTKHPFLWDFNKNLLSCVFQLLHWDKKITETDSYQKEVMGNLLDIRDSISPQHQVANTGQQAGGYPQVFSERHGFTDNLSILDLLFCMGPQSELYLQGILPLK